MRNFMDYRDQQAESDAWHGQGQTQQANSYSNAALAPAPPSTVLSLLDGLEMMASDMRQHAESAESLADRIAGAIPMPGTAGANKLSDKLSDKSPMSLIDRLQFLSNDLAFVRSRIQESLGRAHARIGHVG